MIDNYEKDPLAIERESFRQIRELTDLGALGPVEQQVAMRVVHSAGLPELAAQLRFSAAACERGLQALREQRAILCDTEMVKQGLTKRMLQREPLCFLNDPRVPELARAAGETRSMAALQLWADQLRDSIVIIGNAPTALFRLLEMLRDGAERPALVIGIPVGFVGADESKQALWEQHLALGIDCITLPGRPGGSAIAASVCNALLRWLHGEHY